MIKLYNTKTKSIEEFKPIKENEISIYSCGPTVYSRQHIGNLRSVVIWDTLKNIFRYENSNIKIIDVINITDVGHLTSDEDEGEDKMIKGAKKENLSILEIAKKYENLYKQDLKKLNINFPKFMPRATEHIKEQIEMIEKLTLNNLTYKTKDGLYFDTQKFKKYGILSNKNIELSNLKNRVKENTEKKHPFDFALWKFVKENENENHILKWESSFGIGFPGWHIECSAMSKKYLTSNFDIHTGGIEHIQIHHEAEIAQSCGADKNSNVNFWLHNQHLLVDNEKMSKSMGNVYNLDNLEEKGFNFLDFRFLCLKFHYRETMNFTFENLELAKNELNKIKEFCKILKVEKKEIEFNFQEEENEINKNLFNEMKINNVIGIINRLIKKVNKEKTYSKNLYDFFIKLDNVFNCKFFKEIEKTQIPQELIEMANKRIEFKKNKNWEKADKLRLEIEKKGFKIIDKNESFEIVKI
jgi:cysteinyl-tRNA synthetase